jgi:hypothetical protein
MTRTFARSCRFPARVPRAGREGYVLPLLAERVRPPMVLGHRRRVPVVRACHFLLPLSRAPASGARRLRGSRVLRRPRCPTRTGRRRRCRGRTVPRWMCPARTARRRRCRASTRPGVRRAAGRGCADAEDADAVARPRDTAPPTPEIPNVPPNPDVTPPLPPEVDPPRPPPDVTPPRPWTRRWFSFLF